MLKQGYKGIFLDVEKALNESQLETFGLQEFVADRSLIILPISDMLQYEEIVDSLTHSDINFMVVDSQTMVGAYTEKDRKITDVRPGIKSLQESQVLKKLKDIIYEKEIAVFLLCHARANIQISGPINIYAPQTKQAGGWALLHTPDVITQISKNAKVRDIDNNIVGNDITIQTTKNKYVAPFRPIKETIYYGKGIDAKLSLIKKALELGVIIHPERSRTYTLPFEPDTKYNSRTIWELNAEQCKQLKPLVEEAMKQ
jgi:RecA/RadA recombinase